MNKQIKKTKNGGFIKDLQNYQKSQSVIKQNEPVIKQNEPVIKQNAPVIKQNAPVVKQNAPVVKQNAPVVKVNGPVVKQNAPVVKVNGPVVKQNGPVVKQNGPVVKVNNVVGVKGDMDGLGKENVINKNLGFDKKNLGLGLKGDMDGLRKENVINKNLGFDKKNLGLGLKGDMDGLGKENVINKNLGFDKKNLGLGLKGDMDGLGKEKGNYTPRFVYLYKQQFEMEAVKNKNDMKGLSPLSGYEHKYNPNYWNNNKNIKNNNNCYSYSVNNKNHKFGKPQPGYFARFNHIQNNQYKCAYFFKRILNDIPSVYLTSFKQKCKKGFHKAFFAIDSNKNEHDYHFYRQDTNQLWSHKPGTTNVINYDAQYKIIKNPLKANRNYTSYNYDKPCFFFCVNNKFGKTKAQI
jgi:hypothetical protein